MLMVCGGLSTWGTRRTSRSADGRRREETAKRACAFNHKDL